jgi:hypothetical protein
MLVSVRHTVFALALMSGCVGVVGEPTTDYQNPTGDSRNGGDGGHDAGRDASSTGRGVTSEASSAGDDDDEGPDLSVVARPDGGKANASPSPVVCPKTLREPLAGGLHIREIALYQTVKISLVNDGQWVSDRAAPVVQGKKSLVRVFVDTLTGYQPHTVRAVLRLASGAGPTDIVDQRSLTASSTDAALTSTFSFQVAPELLTASTQLSVSLQESSCDDASGDPADARFPAEGLQALAATEIDKLKVVIVPVRVDGRVPVTSDAELANMRASLLAYYPVPAVDLSVRSPLDWTSTVDPLDGASWSDLLNQIMRERRTDAPGSNTYYFGLVQPAATFRNYCVRGCVLGLAPQTTSVMPNAQVALGASFADPQTYETMVHELGHAHGRGHAPCVENGEIDGVDAKYPEPTGATGSWGWDSRTNMLEPPTNKDIMGYCEPNWISAYNYAGIAARSLQVNEKSLHVGATESWQHILLYADRTARWGGSTETGTPSGEFEQATVLDASGQPIDQVEVVRIPLSHTGDAFLYIPTPEQDWASLKLKDQTLVLSKIKPAL